MTEECEVKTLVNSPDVNFDIQYIGTKKKLVGLTIHVKEPDETEAMCIASEKADLLYNLITVKYRKGVNGFVSGIDSMLSNGSKLVTAEYSSAWADIRTLDFDLNDPQIQKILNDDFHKRLYHQASVVIRSYFMGNFADSVRAFWLNIRDLRRK